MTSKTTASMEHRALRANGIRMHLVEQGSGPLVLLCHGFPESWYSYRHQLRALAAAGYRAVAPDMPGYGDTERPEGVEQYTLLHLVGDMVGVLDALGEESAVIVGHDWGAPVAWHCALLRPDRFRGVVGLSVPYRAPGQQRPTSTMPQTDEALFYQLYFQEPGVAEADLERDPRQTLRRLLVAVSGDAPRSGAGFQGMVWAAGAGGAMDDLVAAVEGVAGLVGDLIEPADSAAVAGTEEVFLPGDGPLLGLYAIRRRPGDSYEHFHDFWRLEHTKLSMHIPGFRYRQLHAVRYASVAAAASAGVGAVPRSMRGKS